MILADKIIRLRRKNGWSQEELAEKMNVSRQAVSKWESAQTVPDLEKILMLGALFGVTTDYLLKDELESEEFTSGEDSAIRRLTLAEANEYLALRKNASVRMAAATFLCIVSVIPLLILSALAESPAYGILENSASAAGLIVLFLFIAAAVAAFLSCSFKNAPYAFLDKEPFDTEYGVTGMVSERQRQYKSTHARCNMVGTSSTNYITTGTTTDNRPGASFINNTAEYCTIEALHAVDNPIKTATDGVGISACGYGFLSANRYYRQTRLTTPYYKGHMSLPDEMLYMRSGNSSGGGSPYVKLQENSSNYLYMDNGRADLGASGTARILAPKFAIGTSPSSGGTYGYTGSTQFIGCITNNGNNWTWGTINVVNGIITGMSSITGN